MSSKKNLNFKFRTFPKKYLKEIILLIMDQYEFIRVYVFRYGYNLTLLIVKKSNIQMDQKGQFLFTIWFGNALTSIALPDNYHFKMCSGDR